MSTYRAAVEAIEVADWGIVVMRNARGYGVMQSGQFASLFTEDPDPEALDDIASEIQEAKRAPIATGRPKRGGRPRGDAANALTERVIAAVNNDPELSSLEIAEKVGVSGKPLWQCISLLKKSGRLLKIEDSTGTPRYTLA